MPISYCDLFNKIEDFGKYLSNHIDERIVIRPAIGPIEFRFLWRDDHLFPEDIGLYVYSRPSGQVVYVGMGNVRKRVWHHLGLPTNIKIDGNYKEQGFPNHRWTHLDVPIDHQLFISGTMLVSAVSVQPASLVRLLEAYAIWYLKKHSGGHCLNIAD